MSLDLIVIQFVIYIFFSFNLLNFSEFMWILTRDKNPSETLINTVKGIIKARGLDINALSVTDQSCN